jgi:hypothetical protein
MRQMKCLLPQASVSFGEYSRRLGKGAIVDFDQVVGQRTDADGHAVDVTMEDLLKGDAGTPGLLHAFEPVEATSPIIE